MPRPKGSPNKNKRSLLFQLKQMYDEDFHPIMKMAEQAVKLHAVSQETQDTNDIKSSIDAWEKIAQYTEPKLKAVEHTGKDGSELIINVTTYKKE